MKNAVGICGLLLLFLALELLHNGMKTAILFLGMNMVLGVLFLQIYPIIDKIVAEKSRDYYFRCHQEYMEKQQQAIRRMEEEIMKHRKA